VSSLATNPRAALVYGSDAVWRRAMRNRLRERGWIVLMASTEAEAAKCMNDTRLDQIYALDENEVRRALARWQPTITVTWMTANENPLSR